MPLHLPNYECDMFEYDVFLSYASIDKDAVLWIAEELESSGLRVWFDDWIIEPGDDIYLQIEQGITSSRCMFFCMSPAAFNSDWISLERSTSIFRDPANRQRRFIPILISKCVLPEPLQRIKYIDARFDKKAAMKKMIGIARRCACPMLDR